jgi:hypothetical protein
MKAVGDISTEDRDHVEELHKYELLIDKDASFPKEVKAQMYVCMAHDFYQMDMEEEGNRLLLKAERVCPGYFKGPVIQQQIESPSFDQLIKNLTRELVYLFMDTLSNK